MLRAPAFHSILTRSIPHRGVSFIGASVEVAPADRFRRFHRGIPPKGKGDFAFIQHMVETTDPYRGRVGVIVPHGVLFRAAAEGQVRRRLIEEGLLDAVIGLPQNLFYGTGIPAAILLFRRDKADESVVFIDASRDFAQGTNQNRLRADDLARIVATYRERATVARYSYVATGEEIAANDFNLNIPRYVDTFEETKTIDMALVQASIAQVKAELEEVEQSIEKYLKVLNNVA